MPFLVLSVLIDDYFLFRRLLLYLCLYFSVFVPCIQGRQKVSNWATVNKKGVATLLPVT